MDSDTTFSLPSLLCEEDDSSLNQVKTIKSAALKPRSEDDHYIQLLIEQEPRSNDCQSCLCDDETARNWLKCARLDAVNWILSTRESLGLHFRTAYLSLAYFDRFNSKRIIDSRKEWAIQLLGIACLSLAAKMEEQNVPLLCHYKSQGHTFESSVIQRMELMVLTTLEWKMCGITPFAYLHHFCSKICDECECNELLVSKASGFVLDFSKEVNLMDHRPSVVALAAVLLACDDQLTRHTLECKIGVVLSLHSLEQERIYRCYNLLKELVNKKNTTPETNSLDILRNQRRSSGNIGIKRKLTYNGFEE